MRIVIAECTVEYTGRLTTWLPPAVRAIIIKTDGSVTVHSDDKGYKPLNWMTKPAHFEIPPLREDGTAEWVFGNSKERLVIYLHSVITDTQHTLSLSEPGLKKKGTEKELQGWLSQNPQQFGTDWQFIAREYPTGEGPVDLLMLNEEGERVAVEVKRVASIGAVDQISRYVGALKRDYPQEPIHGCLIAFDVRPRARLLIEQRGFHWREIDKEEFLNSS